MKKLVITLALIGFLSNGCTAAKWNQLIEDQKGYGTAPYSGETYLGRTLNDPNFQRGLLMFSDQMQQMQNQNNFDSMMRQNQFNADRAHQDMMQVPTMPIYSPTLQTPQVIQPWVIPYSNGKINPPVGPLGPNKPRGW